MTQSWLKYKSFYTLLFFLFLSLLFMTFLGRGAGERRLIDNIIVEIIAPFHSIADMTVNWLKGIWEGYIWLVGMREENEALKKRIDELESSNRHFFEIELENQRLKYLLEFREKLPASIISARLIGKDATSWFQSILLDKGSRDGVKINQPVVTHKGLVGKVVRTTNSTALIELITDKNSSVAAMIQKNRAEGILCGQSSPVCTLEYLDRDVDVETGDAVITSGTGGIFPKGLVLGVVSKVEKKSYGLFQYVEVSLMVPFSRLEEVLILSNNNGDISAEGISENLNDEGEKNGD